MMAATDAGKKAKIAPRNFIGEHKRGNPCGIRPETQSHDVQHQANLFCVIDATLLASDGIPIGYTTAKGVNFGLQDAAIENASLPTCEVVGDPFFHRANRIKVLIHLLTVIHT